MILLKVTTKGRYGLRFMIQMAMDYSDSPVLLKDIAAKQEISGNYLVQIVTALKAAGLIHSSRGAHGGYYLSRTPEKIRIGEIIEAIEGPLSLVECVHAPSVCKRVKGCIARDLWKNATEKLAELFNSVTLAELVNNKGKKPWVGSRLKK